MSLKRVNFARAAKAELTADDREVLHTIYQSRLRTFAAVYGPIALIVGLYVTPYLIDSDGTGLAVGIAAFLMLALLPGAFVFFKYVWAYKRDLRAGYKYVIHQLVIGKQYFPHTDQYFLHLDDVHYLHHEVTRDTYDSIRDGDRYPVFFAAHSRYPFTLNARITMM